MSTSNFQPADKIIKIRSDVSKLMNVARQLGLANALKIAKATAFYRLSAMEGHRFDSKYHIETSQPVRLVSTMVESSDLIGYQYVGTSPWVARTGICLLPISREKYVFFDVGCGKGRVLIIAAERGFRKVVGIDIAEKLLEVARQNIKRFKHNYRNATQIEIIKSDATKFEWPAEKCVLFYFAAPRDDGGVLKLVLRNVYDSLKNNPREMYLILVNDYSDDLQDTFPLLKMVRPHSSLSSWVCSKFFSLKVFRF